MGNVVSQAIMRQIHIPNTKKVSKFYKRVGTIAGNIHYKRWHMHIASSSAGGNLKHAFRFEPTMGNYSYKGDGAYGTLVNYGTPVDINTYPVFEEILIRYCKLRMTFTFTGENMRYRVCLAKRYPAQQVAGATWDSDWNHEINSFQNRGQWKVLTSFWINNSGYKTTYNNVGVPTEDTMTSRVVVKEMFFPINRVFKTSSGITATSANDWIGQAQDADYTYLFFDNDDVSTADGQSATVRWDCEYVYEAIN